MIHKFVIFSSFLLSAFVPTLASAACPETFQNIPFLTGACSTETYVNALYQLAIALAAILVVLRLMWAGAQYMLTGLVTSKETAKKEIRAAILGLIIILAAVTILNTINPQLTNLDFLRSAEPVGLESKQNVKLVVTPDKFVRGTKFDANCNGTTCGGGGVFQKLVKACEDSKGTLQTLPKSSDGGLMYYCL